MTASADWMVEAVNGTFQVRLEAADVAPTASLDESSRAFLERRMKVCPVSRNLPGTVTKSIVVEAA